MQLSSMLGVPRAVLVETVLAVAVVVSLCKASVSRCPEGRYMDRFTHTCQTCSTCPVNQIIRRPCSQDSNTLCGPFSEFLEFHQAPRPSLEVGDLPLPDEGYAGTDGRGSDSNRSKKFPDGLFDDMDDDGPQRGGEDPRESPHVDIEVYPAVGGSSAVVAGKEAPTSSTPCRQDSQMPSLREDTGAGENQWKVLGLALIVVLCVVCVFLIVFVFVVCYLRSRRAHLKQVLYSADTARNAGRTFPTNQYVPVLTHSQARAGCSGGAMEAPPCGMVDSSYLYSEDYDADHSGQTISTAKSSDYVYFKSPHNGNNIYDV